jgi:hypothetical protein
LTVSRHIWIEDRLRDGTHAGSTARPAALLDPPKPPRATHEWTPTVGGAASFQVYRPANADPEDDHQDHERTTPAMYDMYPDWGPASHHPDNPRSHENVTAALQASLDLRDNGGQRPDDN